jgi:hypothetical protein
LGLRARDTDRVDVAITLIICFLEVDLGAIYRKFLSVDFLSLSCDCHDIAAIMTGPSPF